jgi:pimeloyl-ACP methyl ester carboxylesterase
VNWFTTADGTRLACTEVGSGPRLVCVPGGPGRAGAYLEDLGGLAEERTLVLLDNRATGRSEVPADPSSLRFDRLAEDVDALREHLGVQQVDLLGHSAGTVVAQAYAAAHGDRLRSLVLVTPVDSLQRGPAARADVPAIRASRASEPWYAEAAEAQAALADAAPAQRQALMRATRPFYYGRWDERTQAHAASADRQMSPRAELGFAAGAEAVDVPALVAALGRLQAPVLVVGAELDGATGVDAVRHVAACFPRAETAVVPRAGHFPWVDEPAAFRTVVAQFLQRVAPAG